MPFKNLFFKITHWESWHHHTKYIPLIPVWLWYCIRSRSLWFFTASNPSLTFGGMEGEAKAETYSQLPPGTFPKSIYIQPQMPFAELSQKIADHQFTFPFAVKPNVGMMGFMFRKINSFNDLQTYHNAIPIEYVIQEFIEYPLEVSVFYYRFPNQIKGTVTGIAKKQSPIIYGDGVSTLFELIEKNKQVKMKVELMLKRHKENLSKVLPLGEKFILANASNRSQGGKMLGFEFEVDQQFSDYFDRMSNYSGQFFYGRYDLKCTSIEDLKIGKNFSVLEFNGAGSGIQHIYGNGTSLVTAWKTILHHWRMMYKISKYNNANGVPYWGFRKGLKFLRKAKKNLEMLKVMDEQFPTFET